MMISRRPVSSPSRVEKYPPPLMGFLRSKSSSGSISSSRSRSSKGRSRASPLFVRRNKSAAAVTQEPSSPKVTCMGQVRVKRSKPKVQPETGENPTRRRCEWIRNAWSHYRSRRKSKSEKVLDSPTSQLDRAEGENSKNSKLLMSPASASTPPINAFLLTRSRSEPYGYSSLAFRFWEEDNQREAELRNGSEQNVISENTETEVPIEPLSSVRTNIIIEEVEFESSPEFIRSKSEPARIGEKMVLTPHEEDG